MGINNYGQSVRCCDQKTVIFGHCAYNDLGNVTKREMGLDKLKMAHVEAGKEDNQKLRWRTTTILHKT